jgi:V/A-type H+-transporting ATPase subunit D
MASLSLSKSSMVKQTRQLKSFERFLPSLDLKRKQLIGERARAREARRRIEIEAVALQKSVSKDLPMLANYEIDLKGLVTLRKAHVGTENQMGTQLPVLESVELEITHYGYLAKPHWVDALVRRLSRSMELYVELEIARRRESLLEEAVRKATQRVNLVEKVLIPRTRAHIKKIQIFLSDAERAAVVRSKIAKRKRAAEALT